MANLKGVVRPLAAAVIASLMFVAGGLTARADDIVNSVDSDDNQISLVVGSSDSTTLTVIGLKDDGQNNCNFTGANTYLEVSVSSSDASVVSVSPSELTFVKCEEAGARTITVEANKVGTAQISLSLVHNATKGSFNFSPATFTVVVSAPPVTNTPPVVSVSGVTEGAQYEYGYVPVALCDVTDAEDGDSSFPATLSAITGALAGHGLGEQAASCSYTDQGGLTASASVTYNIVDTTKPTIEWLSTEPDTNSAGWNNTDVTVTWTCTDNVKVEDDEVTDVVTGEGEALEATGTCVDVAGNTASDTVTGIRIDRTAPSITWDSDIADGDSFYFGDVPAAPTCEAVDSLSGPDGCSVTGYSTAVGEHTVTATAHDKAGNETIEDRAYEVMAWTLNGFYRPVDMDGVWNTVKGGSTVPLKFNVFAGDKELTDTDVIEGFSVKVTACESGGAAAESLVEFTTTGNTTLRYDHEDGQFIQNWKTPKKAGACYQVTMTTQDGSSLDAMFKLK